MTDCDCDGSHDAYGTMGEHRVHSIFVHVKEMNGVEMLFVYVCVCVSMHWVHVFARLCVNIVNNVI